MGSICGIFCRDISREQAASSAERMSRSMHRRGPDSSGMFSDEKVALASNRLAIRDSERGNQPFTVVWQGHTYVTVLCGEIYDTDRISRRLRSEGVTLRTQCDTEILAYSYALWGDKCLQRIEGMFAFAIYDRDSGILFCARDRQGIKPFYYLRSHSGFYFASEPKAFFAAELLSPKIDREGLYQLLYLAPITLPASAVFCGISQLGGGEYLRVTAEGMEKRKYWSLIASPHYETFDETVACTASLVENAVRRRLVSDTPVCTMLSGGLDSSVVSAIAAGSEKEQGRVLSTYSLLYEDNEYEPTLFQPSPDDEFAVEMSQFLSTDHTALRITNRELADGLSDSVIARDMPGQADIDSSMLWLCGKVSEHHRVTLTGEGGDEVFGGYPWYYRPEMLQRATFPWLHSPTARAGLFRFDVTEGMVWLGEKYRAAVDDCPTLDTDTPDTRTCRVATSLTMRYFMASLLARMDRLSSYYGLEARVPFADTGLVEYVFNIPWEMKHRFGVEKSLLRDAMRPYLPDSIYRRKKSPFPKTHSPAYERTVYRMLTDRLLSGKSRIAEYLLPDALDRLSSGSDVTWFGQLMGRAQLFAWLYQLDLWLDMYSVEIDV